MSESRRRISERSPGVWGWEVVGKDGRQGPKGPGYTTLGEAEANEWFPPAGVLCPDHQTPMSLNMAELPVCGRPGCNFGP